MFNSINGSLGQGPRKPRNRSKEGGVGRTDKSHEKHDLVRRAMGGQIGAYRIRNKGLIAYVDGNAGDGEGVEQPQADLFRSNASITTAELVTRAAEKDGNAVAILCERNRGRRAVLKARFPNAIIIGNNSKVLDALPSKCQHIVFVSDPNGPGGHGKEAMREIAMSISSDFVIVFNEQPFARMFGETKSSDPKIQKAFQTMTERYPPEMLEATFWADWLGRKSLASTPLFIASQSFHYRVIVAANVLSDALNRSPFKVIR